MCGIYGFIRKDAADINEHELLAATDSLAHRGPDGMGHWKAGTVGFGHRRLAIIDPETGNQPLVAQDTGNVINYNGELYNFKELRAELESMGHRFYTSCDTEVVLRSYEQWGADCVKHFRGMFAFAVADVKRRRVFLARDHFGIKPLYYRQTSRSFAFASELPALTRHERDALKARADVLPWYFRLHYIPSPATIYTGIWKLEPGHFMEVSFSGEEIRKERYFEPKFHRSSGNLDLRQWHEEIEATLKDSIKAHLVADVPFGVLLSGGIDSTLVTAYMAEALGKPVTAFTIGFESEEHDEIPYALQAAQTLGTELVSEVVTEASLSLLPDLIQNHFGEPFADASALPTWYLARMAGNHVRMVLSGDGGDESFAGYYRYAVWHRHLPLGFLRDPLATPIQKLRYMVVRNVRAMLNGFSYNDYNEWQQVSAFSEDEDIAALLPNASWNSGLRAASLKAHLAAKRNTRIAYAQEMDFRYYLPDCILQKVDRASMCHGLEVRVPFIDVKLFELISRMPEYLKTEKTAHGLNGKLILKKLLSKRFSHAFVHRAKQAFHPPRESWFSSGRLGNVMLNDMLRSSSVRLSGLLNSKAVEKMLAAPNSDSQSQVSALYAMLVFIIWADHSQVDFV